MEAESELAQGHVSLGPDKGLEALLLDRDVAMLEHARDVGGCLVSKWLDRSQVLVL